MYFINGLEHFTVSTPMAAPATDQPIREHDECACGGVWFNPYGRNLLRRGDVVAGCEQRWIGEFKLLGNHLRPGGLGKASNICCCTLRLGRPWRGAKPGESIVCPNLQLGSTLAAGNKQE